MAENLTLEEIQAQKEALLNAARGNIKNSTNVYQDYLNNAVNQENQGALYSYRNNPTASETDRLQSRSAYLNRRAQNEEARAEADLINALNDDIYANYLEADALKAKADMDALRYKDAVYQDSMAYLRERDKVADEQWQKNYDMQLAKYYQALANSRSGRSSGGYYRSSRSSGNTANGFTNGTPNATGLDRYAMSLYGRAMKDSNKSNNSKDVNLYNAALNGASQSQLEALYKLYNK